MYKVPLCTSQHVQSFSLTVKQGYLVLNVIRIKKLGLLPKYMKGFPIIARTLLSLLFEIKHCVIISSDNIPRTPSRKP